MTTVVDTGADQEDLIAAGHVAAGRLRDALRTLGAIAVALDGCGVDKLTALARDVEDAASCRTTFDLAYLARLMSSSGQEDCGTTNTAGYLAHHLGISRAEANARVRAAETLGDIEPDPDGSDLTADVAGQEVDDAGDAFAVARAAVLEQQRADNLATIAAKAAEGGVALPKLEAVRKTVRNLRADGTLTGEDVKTHVFAGIQEWSVDQVRSEVRALIEASNKTLGPDPFRDLRKRGLRLADKPGRDGDFQLSGRLPAHTAALLRKYLNTHAVKGSGIELPDGVMDRRTAEQRNADAFGRLVGTAVGEDEKVNGGHASIVVTLTGDVSSAEAAGLVGQTNVGIDLTLAQALRLGLGDKWYAALIDGSPAPKRLASTSGSTRAAPTPPSALPSRSSTDAASTPAVNGPSMNATSITSSPSSPAAGPTSRTSCRCAATTTPSTTTAGAAPTAAT